MSDLETFAPTPRIVTLNDGTPVEIRPLRLGQMPAFARATKPFAGYIFIADYLTILDQHAEAVIEMLLAYGFKRERVESLLQDETVALISAIYEVNSDFFIQRLRPAMTKAAAGARATMAAIGALSSPSLPGAEPDLPPASI